MTRNSQSTGPRRSSSPPHRRATGEDRITSGGPHALPTSQQPTSQAAADVSTERSNDTPAQGVGAPTVNQSPTAETLTISIVMPVRNEATHICETLDQLLAQTYPIEKFEILVVDGRSTDDTRQLVERYVEQGAPIRLLDNPRHWSSSARNLGVSAAAGDVVLVIDGHCEIPNDRHLEAVAHAFQTSGADVVGRPQPLTVHNANPLQRAIAVARASRLGHHPDSFIYASEDRFVPAESVGAAYRREVFDRIGFFDEQFDACEDVDFNYRADRAGLRCFLAAKAKVHYYPRRTLRGLFVQLARYGRGRVRLARKHPATCSWKSMVPAAFVAWLLVTAILSPWLTWARLLFLGTVGIYGAALCAESLRLAVVHRLGWPTLWLPAVFVAIHFAAGYGVLREGLTGLFRRSKSDA